MSEPIRSLQFYQSHLQAVVDVWILSWDRASEETIRAISEYEEIKKISSKEETRDLDRMIEEIHSIQERARKHIENLTKIIESEKFREESQEPLEKWKKWDQLYEGLYWKYINWADEHYFVN